ncbi:ATP-binding protein [Flavobacterium sp. W21_SRS_FM6]|uniref:ATP-binding protein n=1 Tax=Flavobacterium sp. W21_SRS_FM6 TaxID=3240268 RepID=UPI003F8F85EB
MKFLSHFNPANHLYIKLFLWFWIVTVIMMSGSMWIMKQLSDEVRFSPMRSADVSELNYYTQILQDRLHQQVNMESIDNVVLHMGKRNQIGLVLVDVADGRVISSLPPRMGINEHAFLKLAPSTSPISVDIGLGSFVGPSSIIYSGKNYLLFVGRLAPPEFMGRVKRQHPEFIFAIALSISALLCFWFARSLVNPIKQLQDASKQMATGNLAIRVGSASKRRDEIGRLGRDFNFMSEQVERLMGSQKRLLADISHELRSPLARLQLSIGILQQQCEEDEAERIEKDVLLSSITRIEKEAAQIDKMIAQVLTLSRLDNPQSLLHKSIVDIQSLLVPLISDARFEAQEQNKHIIFDSAQHCYLDGDGQMLTSAIENVLRNAINYASNIIEVSLVHQDSWLTIDIRDDGKGIEQEQLSRIFEPFYRESLARDRASGGVGLGLAIAHQAILQHQGKIRAVNLPNGGLSVTISLPTVNDEALT